MAKRLYVGNLPYSATADELREVFSAFGTVTDVHIVLDRESGRPRGFGFVTIDEDEGAEQAIARLNDKDLGGRPMKIKEAMERGARPGGGPPGPRGDRPGGPGPRFERGGPPPRGRDEGGPPPRGPRPPRGPVMADPGPMPEDDRPRRQRSPAPKRPQEDRGDSRSPRLKEEEDDYDVANWRQFLDEADEGTEGVASPIEYIGGEEAEEADEEEDWRKYVDDDEGPGTLGGRLERDGRSNDK